MNSWYHLHLGRVSQHSSEQVTSDLPAIYLAASVAHLTPPSGYYHLSHYLPITVLSDFLKYCRV